MATHVTLVTLCCWGLFGMLWTVEPAAGYKLSSSDPDTIRINLEPYFRRHSAATTSEGDIMETKHSKDANRGRASHSIIQGDRDGRKVILCERFSGSR
ncbi:diguanylate cyclase/phosphodiesterase [Anopheles sinensis]|uniref:Diguanylate cyclase/phosphodiesterase n=1 Tax=Anopheles sinensis TaxID=74873 RepID=A0A084VKS7_ANOSI|nr:diguanylate cyclase/phosphodiesterase [Anopheles sinensis]